jgi:muramoyltetrapeptide carboxypeptidase
MHAKMYFRDINMNFIIPPYLEKGDTIAIAAPARSVQYEQIQAAVEFMQGKGFKVYLDPELYATNHQFAGNERHRADLFNRLLDNDEVKAIWCARGGYGTARMVDLIDFELLKKHPKWVAGFSDITVLLSHIAKVCNMATIHSSMPVFMNEKAGKDYTDVQLAFKSLYASLRGKHTKFNLSENPSLNLNNFSGEIVGGNLSVLYSIMGSDSEIDWTNKILFLEDLDEYFYHVDRMLLGLKRAGKLKGLKAVLVGSFMAMHDHTIPFGYSVEEIVAQHCGGYGFPIIFDINSGHHLENIAIPFGVTAEYKDGMLTFANL